MWTDEAGERRSSEQLQSAAGSGVAVFIHTEGQGLCYPETWIPCMPGTTAGCSLSLQAILRMDPEELTKPVSLNIWVAVLLF